MTSQVVRRTERGTDGSEGKTIPTHRLRVLRQRAEWRRLGVPLLLPLPLAIVLSFDVTMRGARLPALGPAEWGTYVLSAAFGGLLWGTLLYASARRRGAWALAARAAFVVFFTIALGGQAYFFQQYNAYLTSDVSRFATDFGESVVAQLVADAANYFSFKAPALLLSCLLLASAIAVIRPRQHRARAVGFVSLALFALSFVLPVEYKARQPSTPDTLYMRAMGTMVETQLGLSEESNKTRPRARKSLPVRAISARPTRPRNVVFVILESVRKDATCNKHDPSCRRTETTNRMFPDRYPLEQLRALDSCTAISMAVLWSGIGPHEDRTAMHTWPLLFDYARAAGYETGYFSSQNLMFGNMRLFLKNLGVDHFLVGNDVDPASHIDLGAPEDQFAARVLAELPKLEEPYFLTIQLSNGHYPYLVDERFPEPFQPASTSKAPDNNAEFKNHYQNAIYQQDMHLGRVLGALRARPDGERTVIVYTSDHGEAFREHGQMGHTFSLFDEEVLVPAWIDAPPGTLSPEEAQHLAKKEKAFTFHPDLTVTILDLLGVWDDAALDPYRSKILGTSLLRPAVNERALPMTNCASVWSCAFENWGYMRGQMKLEGRAWDSEYHCWDLGADPDETANLGAAACGDLKERAQQTFRRFPGKD